MDLGYARVSTTKQDLDRQVDALVAAGVPAERIYVDKKSGATTDRPGLRAILEYARAGDVIVVHTLDRLGRTVRDTLNLIHDLTGRGIGLRNLADPIRVDTTDPADPVGQLAVGLLALFAQMERTYTIERTAGARAAAAARGRQVGRPVTVDADRLAYAVHLRDVEGLSVEEIVAKTKIPRSSLYRHLPPRPTDPVTAIPSSVHPGEQDQAVDVAVTKTAPSTGRGVLESVTWPPGYNPACPRCGTATTGLADARARAGRTPVLVTTAQPCGCLVDEHAAALQAAAPVLVAHRN